MPEPDFLLFASDATWAARAAGALLLVSLVAVVGERRRMRRRRIDAVGWMPWTTLSVLSFFLGATLLAMAVVGWLRG